jgi:hypothetical protein
MRTREGKTMAFKFPCEMTEEEKNQYHARRFEEARQAGAKRFGLKPDEVLFYNKGICYDRIEVTTKRAARKVAKSVKGDTVNGGFLDGMPLGGISDVKRDDGKVAYSVYC